MTIQERIAHAKQQENLTVEEVALIARYSPKYVYEKASKGQIPGAFKQGKSLRFKRADILRWAHVRCAEF